MNVIIREWKTTDWQDLKRFANNRAIWKSLADAFPHPYTEEDAKDFIAKSLSNNPRKLLAITLEGKAIGSIGLFPDSDIHRKNAAIAYWIAEEYWGKGIATSAIQLMVNYGFSNFDIDRIYAKPFGSNKASHRALEKAGFTREAIIKNGVIKEGKYLDEYIYAITR